MGPAATEYELLIRDLIEAKLQADCPAAGLEVFHNQKLIGRSGHEHQIDVVATLVLASMEILILVECKYYAHSVGVDELMEFYYRISDIGAHKGIVVTTIGFQEGAIKVAKAHRISLVKAVNLRWEMVMPCLMPSYFQMHKRRKRAVLDDLMDQQSFKLKDLIFPKRSQSSSDRCAKLGLRFAEYGGDWCVFQEPFGNLSVDKSSRLRHGYKMLGPDSDYLLLDRNGLFTALLLGHPGNET